MYYPPHKAAEFLRLQKVMQHKNPSFQASNHVLEEPQWFKSISMLLTTGRHGFFFNGSGCDDSTTFSGKTTMVPPKEVSIDVDIAAVIPKLLIFFFRGRKDDFCTKSVLLFL